MKHSTDRPGPLQAWYSCGGQQGQHRPEKQGPHQPSPGSLTGFKGDTRVRSSRLLLGGRALCHSAEVPLKTAPSTGGSGGSLSVAWALG